MAPPRVPAAGKSAAVVATIKTPTRNPLLGEERCVAMVQEYVLHTYDTATADYRSAPSTHNYARLVEAALIVQNWRDTSAQDKGALASYMVDNLLIGQFYGHLTGLVRAKFAESGVDYPV